jgi:Zn-dependent protease/CBS domain-containing protein
MVRRDGRPEHAPCDTRAMPWAWKVGRLAGIDLYVHATFVLLLGWVALRYWVDEQSVAAVASGVLFILALFGCVVLHEYGHALTARHYGIPTRDITLLPIGGVARLERMPDDPTQELWVALAGPAVNVAIAVLLLPAVLATGELEMPDRLGVTDGPMLERLLAVNISLALFNLLPAFPMDGGRVLRALLARRLEYTRATQVAANVGQFMALVFGFVGLQGNPFLLFIALFVWIGAAQESSAAQMRYALAGIPVTRALITDFRTLSPGDPVQRAVDLLLSTAQKDFPVVDDEQRVVGIVLHSDLPGTLARAGAQAAVDDVMRRDFVTVDAHEMLEAAFQRLQACDCHTMPVVRDGRLTGLLTMDNIGEFLSLHAVRAASPAGRRAA